MRKIFIIVLFFTLLGCEAHANENELESSNEPQKYKVNSNEVDINGFLYTQRIIKGYLDKVVINDNEDIPDRLLNPEDKVLSYFIFDSKGGSITKASDIYLRQISDLTGLILDKKDIDDIENANFIWLHLMHPSNILAVPDVFIKLLSTADRVGQPYSLGQDIINIKNGLFDEMNNDWPVFSRRILRSKKVKKGNQDEDIKEFIGQKILGRYYQENIDKYIKDEIFIELVIAMTPVEKTMRSAILVERLIQNFSSTNEINPLDKALLKAWYSDDFMLGATREETLDWLSREMFKLIKSGEIK